MNMYNINIIILKTGLRGRMPRRIVDNIYICIEMGMTISWGSMRACKAGKKKIEQNPQ